MRAYVQYKAGQPVNLNAFVAEDGFRQLGLEVEPFEAPSLETLPLTADTLVQGYVGVVQRALERLGVEPPFVPDFPDPLLAFTGRRIRRSTLGEVRGDDRPVFVKPYRDQKAFTGYVRGRDVQDLARSAHLSDEFPVWTSEVVTFVSEWRCFVLRGVCIGVRPYVQDHRTPVPDLSLVEACIDAYGPAAPAGYSIDLGRTADGRTLLVEVNDGYSLAAYGLPAVPYAQLLEARWTEMATG